MKNKIKYLVGTMVCSLMLLALPVVTLGKTTALSIDSLQSSATIEPNKLGKIVLKVNLDTDLSTIVVSFSTALLQVENVSGFGASWVKNDALKATITIPAQLVAVQNGLLNVSVRATPTTGTVGVTFDSDVADVVTNITIATIQEGAIGDYCDDKTRNCKAASNLVCTPCSAKTGLTCAKPKVCLGDVGYTPCKVQITGDSATVSGDNTCGTRLICGEDDKCINDYGGGSIGEWGVGKATTDIRDQIRSFINIALGFLGVAGAIIVLYGGVLWMTARGDDEQVKKAKSTIVSGVIGIVIILLAWTIVSYVLKLGGQVST